jgi:dephospho-CoA kinase
VAILGLTGGIACGKTHAASGLALLLGCDLLSADEIVHRLLREDAGVRGELAGRFGGSIFAGPNGELDRARMREIVFADPQRRRVLEEILHPRVRSEWTGCVGRARREDRSLLVEIPLLYETGAGEWFDRVVVVAAPRETQLERLTEIRGMPRQIAERMIDAQMPLPEKIRRADHVVWNGGLLPALDRQVELVAGIVSGLLREKRERV